METTHSETQTGTESGHEGVEDDSFYFEVVGEIHGPAMRVRDEGVMEDYFLKDVEESMRRSGDEYLLNAAARQFMRASPSEQGEVLPPTEEIRDPMAIERAQNYLLSTVPRLIAKRLTIIAESGGDVKEVTGQLCNEILVL